jgi:hypothetical protein
LKTRERMRGFASAEELRASTSVGKDLSHPYFTGNTETRSSERVRDIGRLRAEKGSSTEVKRNAWVRGRTAIAGVGGPSAAPPALSAYGSAVPTVARYQGPPVRTGFRRWGRGGLKSAAAPPLAVADADGRGHECCWFRAWPCRADMIPRLVGLICTQAAIEELEDICRFRSTARGRFTAR